MKKLFFILGLVALVQFASAQDATTTEPVYDSTIKVTLADTEAESAKLLKTLEFGKLFKGESRTVFFLKASSQSLDALRKELSESFPSCTIQVVAEQDK